MSLQKINLSKNANSMAYNKFSGTISCNGSIPVPYSAIRSIDGTIVFTILGEMAVTNTVSLSALPLTLTFDNDLIAGWETSFESPIFVRYGPGNSSKIGKITISSTTGLPSSITPNDGISFTIGTYPINTVGTSFSYPSYKLT